MQLASTHKSLLDYLISRLPVHSLLVSALQIVCLGAF